MFIKIVNHSLTYNPSIDGLRGVAVLLVIFFHIWPNYFSFGYVGVDIFFVLSGYLITQIIYSNLQNNKFSILKFYRNRIRRIFPSLIIVLISATFIAYLFLFPIEFEQLGKHIKSSAFFYENFRLSKEIGYWDEASQLKPLLHFWSLAIEEQFYIFWPLILLLMFKLRLNGVMSFAIISIIFFLIPLIVEMDKFYNIMARAWELAFGGFSFILVNKYKNILEIISRYKILFYIFFIVAILFSYQNVAFNTFKTLWVVVATCMLVLAISNLKTKDKVLANKFLVFIGLISYPLYLWHYVFISYAHIFNVNVGKNGIYIILISIFLSYILYRFVEIHARARKDYKFAIFLFAIVICIGFFGNYISSNKGLANRQHLLASNKYYEKQFTRTPATDKFGIDLTSKVLGYKPTNNYIKSTTADISKKFVLIIGDSHAHTSYPGLEQTAKKYGYESILLANSSCPPYMGGGMGKNLKELSICEDKIKTIYNLIDSNLDIRKIILVSRFGYMYDMGFGLIDGNNKPYNYHYKEFFENSTNYNQKNIFFQVVESTFKFFENKNSKFYYLIENPELGFSPKNCLLRPFNLFKNECKISFDTYINRAGEYRKFINNLSSKYKFATILDPKDMYCDGDYCYATKDGKMLYADDDHHSIDGSIMQAKYFEKLIFRDSNDK